MATYKLIQDIEAEDHILGPLTLRQFIFALLAIFLFYVSFLMAARLHAPFLLVVFLPPALFFGFFALPFGRDQPTEIWFLAKLRYWFKPRKRIWNQDGIKELVTVTAPKKVEPVLTNGLSEVEVDSRLKALANTLDSRGWAVKNVNINVYSPAGLGAVASDRLIDINSVPQSVPDANVTAIDDIMDDVNPIAQQFDDMIDRSEQTHRKQLVDKMNVGNEVGNASTNYWFMNDGQPSVATALPGPQATQIDRREEAQLSSQLKAKTSSQPTSYGHLRTIQPLGSQPIQPTAAMPPSNDPAIMSLANNDDLNVATIAREAKRAKEDEDHSEGEVVIPLR